MLYAKIMIGCYIITVFFLADNVPTLTPTESPHRYGDLLSVDPLTTENSAYGLGDNQEEEELSKSRHNLTMCVGLPVYAIIYWLKDCTFLFSNTKGV